MCWSVIVNILVVVTVKKISKPLDIHGQVISTGEGTEFAEEMRMTECDVGGVKGPEGQAMGNGALVTVLYGHKRQHFVENVFLVLHVPTNAVLRSHPFSIKTVVINTVDAEELQLAMVDLVSQTMMHPQPFVLTVIPITSWENQHLGSSMTNQEQAHFPTDPMTVPFMKLEVHS